ncbi:centrosomal AT-AC splicing factor isoform X3 [Prionailurus viverrinus]|uniref:centrosomal AT-AC splicing factor isoform X3 n=1 Tax=Prionailurus viverrinus TaxID=61388 RepID=UPI001FF311A8|nr:centrosomal AT-AC splicing factor isoform X3 [Prionailurus viverrinus]
MAPAQRCPLCRQTFFCGRGHVYSRKHQRQLKEALERLLPQVEAARKAIRAAQVERYVPEHDRCCWCLCCGREVRKHLSHGNLTVLHGGLLEHLASPEHKKATNRFWWENKAEFQMKEKFLISSQDYARCMPKFSVKSHDVLKPIFYLEKGNVCIEEKWSQYGKMLTVNLVERFKKSMVKGLDSYEEKEDEVIKEMAAQIREVEHSRQELVRSVLEPQAVPDPEEGSSALGSWKGTNSQVASSSQQPSYLDLPPAPELDWMETGQPLTFIGHQELHLPGWSKMRNTALETNK